MATSQIIFIILYRAVNEKKITKYTGEPFQNFRKLHILNHILAQLKLLLLLQQNIFFILNYKRISSMSEYPMLFNLQYFILNQIEKQIFK